MVFNYLSVSLSITEYVSVFYLSISSDYEIPLQMVASCTNQIKDTFFLELVVIETSCDS